jgi:hypothetical protein
MYCDITKISERRNFHGPSDEVGWTQTWAAQSTAHNTNVIFLRGTAIQYIFKPTTQIPLIWECPCNWIRTLLNMGQICRHSGTTEIRDNTCHDVLPGWIVRVRMQQASQECLRYGCNRFIRHRFLSSVNSVNWNNVWNIRIKREREWEQRREIINNSINSTALDIFTIPAASQCPILRVQNIFIAVAYRTTQLHPIWRIHTSISQLSIYNTSQFKQL